MSTTALYLELMAFVSQNWGHLQVPLQAEAREPKVAWPPEPRKAKLLLSLGVELGTSSQRPGHQGGQPA